MNDPQILAEQERKRKALLKDRARIMREVACRLVTEHERLAAESRTIAIQMLTLEQELDGTLPIASSTVPPPMVVPLR